MTERGSNPNPSRDDSHEPDLDAVMDDRDDQRQLADRRWIDSLLRRTLRPEAARRDARIQRALSSVRRDATRRRIPTLLRPASVLAVAALVLLGLGIVWVTQLTPELTADDAMRSAYAAALSQQDREYTLRADVASMDQPLSGSIYLRGETHYCVRMQTGRFGEAWFGSNGHEGWLVPGLEAFPVMVTRDLSQLYEGLKSFGVQPPFLQITTTIESLREHYDIQLETPNPAVPGAPPLFVQVRGTRRSDLPFLADRVEFRAHPQRGTIQQLVVEWTDPAAKSRLRRLTFDLVSEKPVADDWYEHAAHHAADRQVRDMTRQPWGRGRSGTRGPDNR